MKRWERYTNLNEKLRKKGDNRIFIDKSRGNGEDRVSREKLNGKGRNIITRMKNRVERQKMEFNLSA